MTSVRALFLTQSTSPEKVIRLVTHSIGWSTAFLATQGSAGTTNITFSLTLQGGQQRDTVSMNDVAALNSSRKSCNDRTFSG